MRKMVHGYIGTKTAISAFRAIQESETQHFVSRVIDNPGELIRNIRL